MDQVILVDENDAQTGLMDKLEAHELGKLHRAFSVFIFNSRGEMLIHQRAEGKYHSGKLWTNTCCSHQLPGETNEAAVKRRLREEMGLACETEFVTSFIYKAELDNNLTEHEFDHVYAGICDVEPHPDPNEVMNWKFVPVDELERDLSENPENYTAWFRIIFPEMKDFPTQRA